MDGEVAVEEEPRVGLGVVLSPRGGGVHTRERGCDEGAVAASGEREADGDADAMEEREGMGLSKPSDWVCR